MPHAHESKSNTNLSGETKVPTFESRHTKGIGIGKDTKIPAPSNHRIHARVYSNKLAK